MARPVVLFPMVMNDLEGHSPNQLNEQLFVQHGCQTGYQTRLTTGWMFVYTIQPVVKPVVQLV